jgi:hypothetical protein
MGRLVFRPAAPPTVALLSVTLLSVTLLAATPVAAHAQSVRLPAEPGYATNSPVADSPLQQQILRNYRSDLLQTQRELAGQNPSGLSREQLDVMHRLNAVNSALIPAPPATMPPAAPGAAPMAAPFR